MRNPFIGAVLTTWRPRKAERAKAFSVSAVALGPALLTALIFILGILPWVRGEGRRERIDLLVQGGTVVTMDRHNRVLENGAVAVRAERIVAIGPAADIAARYEADHTVDATGHVVMPGLINTHTHAPMVLFRGLADDLPLMEWLHQYIFPAEAKNVDEDFVRWGTRLACLEMIQGGITTYVDMYYFEEVVADETAKAGLRGVLGEAVLDFPTPDHKTWADAMAGCEKYIRRWKGHPLVTPAIAPHAPYTVSTEHLKEAHAFARMHEVPLIIHVAETEAEVKTIRDKYKATPVGYLDGLGVLDEGVIAAHSIWLDDADIKIMARRSVGVAHCPQSNMKLASGVAPVPRLLKAGVAVGLGTDGAASNNVLNIWEEIDTAAKLHKLVAKDPSVLNAHEALELATIGGARAIHSDKEIGSLEVGKLADLIVVRMDGAHQTPLYDVYSQLVYATKFSDVETVVVNGKLVMDKRKVLTVDEPATLAKARDYAKRVRETLRGSPAAEPPKPTPVDPAQSLK
jgi:5-methylthioadenosine/S-adenosylhomocysteine deaminase